LTTAILEITEIISFAVVQLHAKAWSGGPGIWTVLSLKNALECRFRGAWIGIIPHI